MDLKTIRSVPIVSTGTYPLGSGETTFTADDLASAVLAASDPTVVAPRIGIGHKDPRFDGELDGEPAMGTVTNLTLSDDGQTVLGDLTDMPAWLADALPSAYPGRSIEGGFNFKAPSGRDYKLVISNLKLLGTTWPGVTSLKDLREVIERNGAVPEAVAASGGRYSLAGGTAERFIEAAGVGNRTAEERRQMAAKGEAMPDGTFPIGTVSELEASFHLARTPEQRQFIERRAKALGRTNDVPESWKVAAAGSPSGPQPGGAGQGRTPLTAEDEPAIKRYVAKGMTRTEAEEQVRKLKDEGKLAAALDLGSLPRLFALDVTAGKVPKTGATDQAKWWARSVQAEDDGALSLLVDTDAGELLALPITVADDSVEYGTPVAVAASNGAIDTNLKGPRVLASWPSQKAARPRIGATRMRIEADIDRAKLVQRLGLPENADDAAINEALGVESGTATTEGDPAAAGGEPAGEPAGEPGNGADPTASGKLPEGVVVIDSTKLAELESGARAGSTIAASLARQERDEAITSAIKGGRIAASRREHFEKRWAVDREGTLTLLTAKVEDGGLAAVIPVEQIEAGIAGDGEGADPASGPRLLPELERTAA